MSKGRKARNRLSVIEDHRGIPCFDDEQIAAVICKFYNDIFKSTYKDSTATVNQALKPRISQKTNKMLIKDPTEEEIREATFTIHPDKVPGPDGFSASFFQANWETVGPEVVNEIHNFIATGSLRSLQNETHVRLIPKITGAKKVSDYRPIALCNVYFKIISKMLSLPLKPILQDIISENQSAFTSGRAISDNSIITHEVLHFLKNSKAEKRCTMAVKSDMSKAYDKVELGFLEQVFRRLDFHDKWTNWIMQCVSTVSYSYLINDMALGSVKSERGI